MIQDIRNLSYEALSAYILKLEEKSFRAEQIFEWLYQKRVNTFDEMTNLSVDLRQRLKEDFSIVPIHVLEHLKSKDRTEKFLFQLHDAEKIEAVLIPTPTRATICLSTQAGCKFGCRFCASGIGGWKRNLSCSEILTQILHVQSASPSKPVSHIVFMGVGEPLDNYDNLLKAIRIMNAAEGLNISARRITVSTCGLIPKIKQLTQERLQIALAISLHGYDNESRNVLMPVNKKYPFSELVKTSRDYAKATKRQVTFEYILIKDVTCTEKAAKSLAQSFKGMLCKINLIPYNKVSEFDHQPPSREEAGRFKNRLMGYGVHATIRASRGRDVAAACGQLRHSAK